MKVPFSKLWKSQIEVHMYLLSWLFSIYNKSIFFQLSRNMFFDFNKTPSLYMYILFPFIEFYEHNETIRLIYKAK